MNKEQLTELLSAQKLTASTVRSIAKEVIDTIELALIGDEESFEKLKLMNSKEYDILATFYKVSALLIKIFPIEHQIAGTELIKNLKGIGQEDNFDDSLITETDIQVMKNYIEHYEKEKNQLH